MAGIRKVSKTQDRRRLRDDVSSIHKMAAKATANALLGQLEAGRTLISIAKRRSPFDEKYIKCTSTVKRILAFTDVARWTLYLQPEDILKISAENESLFFELEAMSRR